MTLSLAAEFLGRIPKITCTFIVVTWGRVSYYLQFAQITITVTAIKSVQFMRYVQYTMCYQYCRDRNVDQHRVDILSTLWIFCLVYIVHIATFIDIGSTSYFFLSCFIDNIVEIAILTDIESISCIFFHVYIVNIAMLFDIVSTSYPFCDVTNVNSISVQHRIHCHVDDVNVKEMSASRRCKLDIG